MSKSPRKRCERERCGAAATHRAVSWIQHGLAPAGRRDVILTCRWHAEDAPAQHFAGIADFSALRFYRFRAGAR